MQNSVIDKIWYTADGLRSDSFPSLRIWSSSILFFCSLVKKGKWEYTCSMHIVFILSLFWHQQIPFFVHKLDMGLYVLPVSWMPIVGVLDSQTSKIVRCKCLLHQYAPVRYWSCLAQLIFSFFTNLSKSSAKQTVSAAAY
jgi:hypothetical protein